MATATAKSTRLFDRRDALKHVVAAQGDPVEESQGGERLLVLAEGDTPFLYEVDQEGANLFGAKMLGRGIKVAGEASDAPDVGLNGLRREIAEGHVLDHAAAQGRGGAPLRVNGAW